MTGYTVAPASILHVKPLSSRLRPEACATLKAFGQSAREALHFAFMSSPYSRTAFIGSKPVAMWGAVNPLLSDQAVVWLALSEDAARFPFSVVRRTKIELAEMARRVGTLYARIGRDDRRALLFAVTMGFRICDDTEDDRMALLAFGDA